jgi:hypothetical protein
MFWQNGNEPMMDKEPFLVLQKKKKEDNDDNVDSESSTIVGCLVLRPPTATTTGRCVLQQPPTRSLLLPDDKEESNLASLCVTGGASLQLGTLAKKHAAYGQSWISWIVFYGVVLFCTIVVNVPLAFLLHQIRDEEKSSSNNNEDEEEGEGEESSGNGQSAAISVYSLLFVLCITWVSIKAKNYVERNSERRLKAVEAFRLDMQSHVTQIKDSLQPFGFTVAVQEQDHHHEEEEDIGDGSIHVRIEKSNPYADAIMPPVEQNETAHRMLMVTKVSASLVIHGCFARNTPLDLWLFGGLMIRMGNAFRSCTTTTTRRCDIIEVMLIMTYWIGVYVALLFQPALFVMMYSFFALPVFFFMFVAMLYYREWADAPSLHAAWQQVVQEVSPIAAQRVGYTMTYAIEPAWFPKTTLGTIYFHKMATAETTEEDDGPETAQEQCVAAQIV